MPARHHRAVDRIVSILERTAQSRSGVSLAELAQALHAPKSSVQELTNGLLAAGYLIEQGGRFMPGPGSVLLAVRSAAVPLQKVRHDQLVRVHERLDRPVFVGVRVGDDHVFVDQAGEDVLVDFVSATRPRRPLLKTATGKIILSFLQSAERNELLHRFEQNEPAAVEAFLRELPSIRETALAYNYAATLPDRCAVATALTEPDGRFLAAICTAGGTELAATLPETGQALLAAVKDWAFSAEQDTNTD